MRAKAAATLVAASLFRRSNHAAYGLRPPRSRYSRTSTIVNSNTYGTTVNGRLSALCKREWRALVWAAEREIHECDGTGQSSGDGIEQRAVSGGAGDGDFLQGVAA